MARRRGRGEGSIYRRASDGRWVAALFMDDGRRVVGRASSRKDAAAKLELLLKARAEGHALAAERGTAAFLNEWLAIMKHTVAPGTFERYEQYIRVHAIPALGRIRLGRLTPQHFQGLYQDKLAAGLSPTTVSHLHVVLHGAFAEAVRWGLLPRNVVSLVRPPRKAHVEVVALTVEQARALLAAAAGNRFEALFMLSVKTGMRRDELLALRWEDVELDRGMLQVRGTLRRTREGLTFGAPRPRHPGARWCCRHPQWRPFGAIEHGKKRSARGSAIFGSTWGWCSPTRSEGPWSPATSSPTCTAPSLSVRGSPLSPSMCSDTPPRRCCCQKVSIPRWSRSCWGMHRSASRWTATAT